MQRHLPSLLCITSTCLPEPHLPACSALDLVQPASWGPPGAGVYLPQLSGLSADCTLCTQKRCLKDRLWGSRCAECMRSKWIQEDKVGIWKANCAQVNERVMCTPARMNACKHTHAYFSAYKPMLCAFWILLRSHWLPLFPSISPLQPLGLPVLAVPQTWQTNVPLRVFALALPSPWSITRRVGGHSFPLCKSLLTCNFFWETKTALSRLPPALCVQCPLPSETWTPPSSRCPQHLE